MGNGKAGPIPHRERILGQCARSEIHSIDRAILRLAIAELRTMGTPPKVVLNEAVELAKKFSTEEAASFVNGILDAAMNAFAEKPAD